MKEQVKETLARLLAEWLFKDFGLLIDEPTPEEIEITLEEYEK